MDLRLPARPVNEDEVRIDFMPFVLRKIEHDGVLVEYIHYYDPILRPYIEQVDKHGKRQDHVFHYDPSDLSRLFFFDELQSKYVAIPYRDLRRPPLTLWERREAAKRARERGRDQVDEAALFRAYEENQKLVEEARRVTKRQRRRNATKKDRLRHTDSTDRNGNEFDVKTFETAAPFEDLEL